MLTPNPKCPQDWVLASLGPDTDEDASGVLFRPGQVEDQNRHRLYNRSNGLISNGDIVLTSWWMQMEIGLSPVLETVIKENEDVQD